MLTTENFYYSTYISPKSLDWNVNGYKSFQCSIKDWKEDLCKLGVTRDRFQQNRDLYDKFNMFWNSYHFKVSVMLHIIWAYINTIKNENVQQSVSLFC